MANQSAANYGYDEIGNLIKDESEEIAEIKWTVYGKVKSVKRESTSTKPDLDFQYTASGQRYLKVVKPKNANGTLKGVGDWKFTFYQHDAQGNVLAVYDIKDNDDDCGYEMYLAQHVLYGSARLGVNNYGNDVKLGTSKQNFSGYVHANYWICEEELDDPKDEIPPVTPNTTTNTGMITLSPGGKYEHIIPIDIGKGPWTKPINVNNYAHVGNEPSKDPVIIIPDRKQYEFSNHLGNVLVTVSDKPIGIDLGGNNTVDYYMPDVLTVSDYEPFGAPLENRTESENLSYRFGYNGVEKENDLYGEGNAYSFEYRIHDARIGRFLSVDPLAPEYPWNSSYAFAENKVIWGKDLEGRELSILTENISNYILEVVEASDIDNGTKNLIAYGVGLYQGATYAADPIRMIYDNLNLNFQCLKTGLPLALQVIQKGSITAEEAKALKLSIPVVQMINGKLDQIKKADEPTMDGAKEGGKLAIEVILIFTAARSGIKSPGKNTNLHLQSLK